MQSRMVGPITLSILPRELETVETISGACEGSLATIRALWELHPPMDCHIYVMTSWWGFILQSAPWYWRLLLISTAPFWAFRARRTWPYSAAWTQRYGRKVAIGIKPPRLLELSDRSMGTAMFVEEMDPKVNIRHVTCHELTHACSTRLHLPMWLNEGLAAVTVDHYLGKETIRKETLQLLREYQPKVSPPTYRSLSRMGVDAIVYHGVRGYWIVRYLERTHPGVLRTALSLGLSTEDLERWIIHQVALPTERFWEDIDELVASFYEDRG